MSEGPDYQRLYEIAESLTGYFAARQARSIGFSWERLSNNVKAGKFLRVAHGIYRLIQFPSSPFEDIIVSWLRAGLESVVSHESALSVYDLSDVMPAQVHLIVPPTSSDRRKGVRQHKMQLAQGEITQREGLPVTTVLRTIADVASAGLAEEQIRLAIRDAIQRGMTTQNGLRDYADHRGGRFQRIIEDTFPGSRYD